MENTAMKVSILLKTILSSLIQTSRRLGFSKVVLMIESTHYHAVPNILLDWNVILISSSCTNTESMISIHHYCVFPLSSQTIFSIEFFQNSTTPCRSKFRECFCGFPLLSSSQYSFTSLGPVKTFCMWAVMHAQRDRWIFIKYSIQSLPDSALLYVLQHYFF